LPRTTPNKLFYLQKESRDHRFAYNREHLGRLKAGFSIITSKLDPKVVLSLNGRR